MPARYFLDTNIFVYSFDPDAPSKARRADQLIHDAVGTGRGVVSYQVVQEFMNLALRRFARPMTIPEAQQYLAVVFRPLLAVHSSPALVVQALDLAARHALSWYDALIVASAIEAGCEILYSEDLQHGWKAAGVEVVNPFIGVPVKGR